MQYPASQPDHTSIIPGHLIHTIIRPALLLILSLFSSFSALAYDCKVDGIYYDLNNDDKTASVTYMGLYTSDNKDAYVGNIIIPESITHSGTTYSVTSIGDNAFWGCSGLTSVTIPNSVSYIGKYAFASCSGLTSVTIPNSVTSIGECAFASCSGLTSVTIPNSVSYIGEAAFGGCSGLTSVTVDKNNGTYDSRDNCNAIIETSTNKLIVGCKNTTIPNSVTSIGDRAFASCSGLTSVTIPNSVTSIGGYAFSGCSGLTSVTVDKNNGTYDSRNNCNAIIETSTNKLIVGCNNTIIPNSVTSIGDGAFAYCSGLTSVTIPNSVTSIGEFAFSDCSGLTSVAIPNSVTSIGDGAFASCSGLTSVTIPNSVTSIGSWTFYGCSGLTSVTFNAEKCTYMGSDSYPVFNDCINITTLNIGNKVTTIPNYAFRECSGLTSVTIPNSVTSIGDGAFADCSGLTSVTIPNSVTSIGGAAFRGCSGLTSVTIGNSVTSIGDYAFYNCTGLHSLTIGTGVLSIGQYAIGYYYNYGYGNRKKTIEKVIWLPNTPPTGYGEVNSRVSYVANDLYTGMSCEYKYIYKYLSSLFEVDGIRYVPVSPSERTCDAIDCTYNQEQTDISLCKTVSYKGVSMTLKDIKPYTCYNNTHITKVIVNYDGNIGDYAFHDCPLKTVYIGGNISYSTSSDKGYSPFYRNTSLEKVIITDKETEITANEFYGCTGLKYISMGDGIEKIGDWAFSGCSSLDFFRVGSNVKTIGKEAFSDCTAMTKLITTAPVPPTCGSQALDDINKWTCELFVNKESINQYKAAEQWKEFFFISEYDGVDDVSVDTPDALYEVYNLQGVRVGSGMHEAEVTADALPHGVYILVSPQGRKKLKI